MPRTASSSARLMNFLSSSIRKKSTFLSFREVDRQKVYHSSFIRTLTVGSGFSPDLLQDICSSWAQKIFTTGGEFRPALKRYISTFLL